jgi:hypothetical protein
MVKEIHLTELRECPDKDWLGSWPRPEDIDTIYHEDVDVFLPNGEKAIAFRVGVLKSTLPVEKGGTLTPEALKYWQWVSKALRTDQRGYAAGKDIVTNPEIRLTHGQWEFLSAATRARNPLTDASEALAIIQGNEKPSRNTYYVKKAEADGLVDLEEVDRWDSICRKKNVEPEVKAEATANRNKAKLAWFNKWFKESWLAASEEDRPAVARAGKKRYVTIQPRANMCYSNVMGTIDRSGRLPFGRLTASTVKRYEEFAAQKDFYQELSGMFKEYLPEKFEFLNARFSDVKDPRYNLFGTVFTTLTVNNNFDVAYHRDGNNAEGGTAALCVMEIGDWKGGEFVFPELGIGFDIRAGDVFVGDNQALVHGMLPFREQTPGAENIMFVAYQRDSVTQLDDLDCEQCRKDFMDYNVIHNQHKGTGEPKWTGSWAGMWQSVEWVLYKQSRGMERCSNSNYWCTGHLPDEEILMINQSETVEVTA